MINGYEMGARITFELRESALSGRSSSVYPRD